MEIEYEGKTIKLFPCPFCGGEAEVRSHRRHGLWYRVRCAGGECPIRPDTYYAYRSLEEAVADWNRRAGTGGAP